MFVVETMLLDRKMHYSCFSDVYGFTGRIYVLQISNAEMLYRIKSFVTDHVIQTFDAQSYTTSLLNHKTFKLYIVEVKKYITAQKTN